MPFTGLGWLQVKDAKDRAINRLESCDVRCKVEVEKHSLKGIKEIEDEQFRTNGKDQKNQRTRESLESIHATDTFSISLKIHSLFLLPFISRTALFFLRYSENHRRLSRVDNVLVYLRITLVSLVFNTVEFCLSRGTVLFRLSRFNNLCSCFARIHATTGE